MKIKYDGYERRKIVEVQDLFYIGWYGWDSADYGFSITILGRSWSWLIDLKKNERHLKAL
jgi:hypothetical protein